MSKWREIKPEQTYTEEQINQRLAEELPEWFYENGWIRRKYKTHSWKGYFDGGEYHWSFGRSGLASS